MAPLFFVYQIVTDFCQLAEFFKTGGGGEKDCNPVIFVHVPGGKDCFFVDKTGDFVIWSLHINHPDFFLTCKTKLAVFYFHHKGKPFLIWAAENTVIWRVGPGKIRGSRKAG